jgi:hypothetical protein
VVSISGHGEVTYAWDTGNPPAPVATCPGACSGTTVSFPVLTATAAAGWSFVGWGGACTGASTCTIPLTSTGTVNVIATFTELSVTNPPPAPTITSLMIKHTTATVRLKRPRTATGLTCALVRDPTTKRHSPPKPLYTSCTTSKIYRHLHTHTSYTLYARAVSHAGHSKAVSRRFTIHS